MMKHWNISIAGAVFVISLAACGPNPGEGGPGSTSSPVGVVSTGPLPDSAYRAAITVLEAPKTMRVGEQGSLRVKVKNLGDGTWPAHGQGPKYKVDLGNHWLDKTGKEVVGDDGRAGLPHDLKSGEEAELLLTVKAPKAPGDYILALDMVHEDVTWFGPRGSQTVKTNITVQ